jgi:hypothetical protein
LDDFHRSICVTPPLNVVACVALFLFYTFLLKIKVRFGRKWKKHRKLRKARKRWKAELAFIEKKEESTKIAIATPYELQPSVSVEAVWNEDAWTESLSQEGQLDPSRAVLKSSSSVSVSSGRHPRKKLGKLADNMIDAARKTLKREKGKSKTRQERTKSVVGRDSFESSSTEVGDDTLLESFLDEVRNVILVSFSFAIAKWDADSIARLYFFF